MPIAVGLPRELTVADLEQLSTLALLRMAASGAYWEMRSTAVFCSSPYGSSEDSVMRAMVYCHMLSKSRDELLAIIKVQGPPWYISDSEWEAELRVRAAQNIS